MVATMRVPSRGASVRTPVTNASAIVPVCVLFTLVYWSYKSQVFPTYAYEGYRFREPSHVWLFSGLVIALVPLSWLPAQPRRASGVTLWIIYLFVVIPICCLTPGLPMRSERWMFGFAAWSVAFLGIASLSQVVTPRSLPRSRLAPRRARSLVLGLTTGTFLLLVATFGFSIGSPGLGAVYTQRLLFRATLGSSNVLLGYLVSWSQIVLAPLTIVTGLVRRSVLWAGVGTVILVWAYFVTATRQSLIAIPFALLLYWAGSRQTNGTGYTVGAALLITLSSVGYAITGNLYVLASISERLFTVPGVLGGYYFDYFADRPPVLLRDGIGSLISSSPYPREMTYQIGLQYLGRADANANVNVIADSFGNFWFAGLFVAIVLACLLWLLDSATIQLPVGATVASLVLVLLALLNVGLTVALLTSGFGLAILVLWIFGESLFDRSGAEHARF